MDDELIKSYIVYEKGYGEMAAELLFDKVTKYEDIRNEFVHWLKERNYDVEEPVVVEGYSALAIMDMNPEMNGIGVYNLLADLRSDPEGTLKLIKGEWMVGQ